MASKVINTILNLKDNMSGGITRVSAKVSGLSKEAQRASKQVSNMANKFKREIDSMASAGARMAAVGAAIVGGLAFKTGLSESLDLEGYRVQLETATKDSKKAGEIMKWAVDLANKTPFEAGPLVEGASKLEMMGMSAQKYLPLIGDMAAATNKPVDQAVEAMIDAQTGELERLKEFGITKTQIAKKSAEMFKNQEVINNKGQIVDQEKFNEALVAIMTERYKGGMDKLSNTTRGMWSTVTGITKSGLASILGMTSDGTIRQGSFLDKLKGKVKELADNFTRWQQDGTIDRLSQQFSDAFTRIYDVISKVVIFISENRGVIEGFIVVIGGFMVAVKVAEALKIAIIGLQIVWGVLSGTLALTPFGWVVIGITALVAAGYLLWKNWDTVSTAMHDIWVNIKNTFIQGVNDCIEKVNSFIEKINNLHIPSIHIDTIQTLRLDDSASIGSKVAERAGRNALGTSYWRGGLTSINERGGEIIDLPNGSKVIPADKSANMLRGGDVKVNVVIQGNVIGNEQFADEVGNHVVNKVVLALNNM